MTTNQVNDLMSYGDRIDVKVVPVFKYGMMGVTFRDMPEMFDYDRALFHLQRMGNEVCSGEEAAA